jgi:hypothetical protein
VPVKASAIQGREVFQEASMVIESLQLGPAERGGGEHQQEGKQKGVEKTGRGSRGRK